MVTGSSSAALPFPGLGLGAEFLRYFSDSLKKKKQL